MNVRPRKEKKFAMRMTDELKIALEAAAIESQRQSVSELAHIALEEKFLRKPHKDSAVPVARMP